jgi:hypothetical protein
VSRIRLNVQARAVASAPPGIAADATAAVLAHDRATRGCRAGQIAGPAVARVALDVHAAALAADSAARAGIRTAA